MSYLKSAAAAQNQRDEPKIILVVDGEPVINTAFDFCDDCTDAAKTRMLAAKRCHPDWMAQQ